MTVFPPQSLGSWVNSRNVNARRSQQRFRCQGGSRAVCRPAPDRRIPRAAIDGGHVPRENREPADKFPSCTEIFEVAQCAALRLHLCCSRVSELRSQSYPSLALEQVRTDEMRLEQVDETLTATSLHAVHLLFSPLGSVLLETHVCHFLSVLADS